jgi:hypothetical protein
LSQLESFVEYAPIRSPNESVSIRVPVMKYPFCLIFPVRFYVPSGVVEEQLAIMEPEI